jgi:hypothetical protein
MKTTTLALVLGLAAVGTPAAAERSSAEEDLAVVKRATASPRESGTVAEAPPRSRAEEPRWLRVRILERGEKNASVKVNLPLALVHALGDDVPVPGCEGREGGGEERLTIGEVLRALDTGESLVEIEDAESTVRIWVE